MSAYDPVLGAMRNAAGLPVLTVLDRFVTARARGEADDKLQATTMADMLVEIGRWLDELEASVRERLATADDGPLKGMLQQYLNTTLAARRRAVNEIGHRPGAWADPTAWALLEAEFTRLNALRAEIGDVQRAATHLREFARLVPDIPRDDQGNAALDELAGLEALAASHHSAHDWARGARELERRCTELVRLTTTPTTKTRSAQRDPTPATPQDRSSPNAAPLVALKVGTNGSSNAKSNGHSNGNGNGNGHKQPVPTLQTLVTRAPSRATIAKPPVPRPTLQLDGAGRSQRGTRPAGDEVLRAWEERVREFACDHNVPEGFRHFPFWAPIAAGLVPAPKGDTGKLLEYALSVEIDVVEIELPRILFIPAGGAPDALRSRIAERAREITLIEPKRPAREQLLDWVTGKFPARYRETADGLALIESISLALATDEPWEVPDHGYAELVRRMLDAELARAPAIDLHELARSLVGSDAVRVAVVLEAATLLATTDEQVTLYPDGILVKASADREDADKLYKLRGALASRLGEERAALLMKALIAAGDENE